MNSTEFASLELNDCHKKIAAYIKTPIEVTDRDYFYILDPAVRPIRRPKGYARGLHSAFGWVPANPNASEARVATNLLYEETASSDQSNSIPTALGFTSLLNQLTNDSRIFDMYLVGNRGSGKTFVQNKLINQNLRELNDQGFTYFRADVAKLHDFNARLLTRESNTSLRMSIQEYMALHAFFVVLSHGNKNSRDPGLVKFSSDFDAVKTLRQSAIEKSIKTTSFSAFIAKENENLVDCWVLVAKSFAKKQPDPDKEDEDLFSYLVCCRENSLLTSLNIDKLFDLFMQFITDQTSHIEGNLPGAKVLLMVDGADNLRTDEHLSDDSWIGGKSSGKWYKLYLQDMKLMVRRRGISSRAHRTIFALRPDTYEELIDLDKAERHHEDLRAWSPPHYVNAPCAVRMFERKRKAAEHSPGASLFNRGLENVDIALSNEYRQEVPELHRCFEHFIRAFFDAHINSLKSCGHLNATENDVLRIVFNLNVRSLSRNAIRTFDAAYHYHKESTRLLHLTAHQRIESFKKTTENYLFELSVTGGNPYFIENSNEEAKGRWCPNLFEFQNAGDKRRWDGLVLMRVLQFLPSQVEETAAPTAKDILKEIGLMEYVPLQVQSALWCAADFGLIKRRGKKVVGRGKSEPTFEKTEKGSYVQQLAFQNLTVMYLMGTGMRASGVGTRDHENPGKRIEEKWLHSPDVKDRHFWSAALKTTAHLLRHIESASLRDKTVADKQFNPKFVLPSLEPIERKLALSVLGLRGFEPESSSIASILTTFEKIAAPRL